MENRACSGRGHQGILASDAAGEVEKLISITVFNSHAIGSPDEDRQHRRDATAGLPRTRVRLGVRCRTAPVSRIHRITAKRKASFSGSHLELLGRRDLLFHPVHQ